VDYKRSKPLLIADIGAGVAPFARTIEEMRRDQIDSVRKINVTSFDFSTAGIG